MSEFVQCGRGVYAYQNDNFIVRCGVDGDLCRHCLEIKRLRDLVATFASAPYPMHDHCSRDEWVEACGYYTARKAERGEGDGQ